MACSLWMPLVPRYLGAALPSSDAEPATHFLPLFPLGIVAFPGELVFLHIFEQRYKQLIAECAEDGITFGIVTLLPGGASSVGTEMELDRILGTDERGNMDIAVRGIRVFTLHRFRRDVEGKLYSAGEVSFSRNNPKTEAAVQNELVRLYKRMGHQTESDRELEPPYPQNLSFFIGHDVGLSPAQELQLLTIPAEHDRQAYLVQHLLRSQ